MTKKLLLISAFIIPLTFIGGFTVTSCAQVNFTWGKQLGGEVSRDLAFAIKTDAAGNVYTMGTFDDVADFDPGVAVVNLTPIGSGFSENIFISKLSATGDFLWVKQWDISTVNDPGDMTVDPAGNVYLIGTFQGKMDVNPGVDSFNLITTGDFNKDVFICKLNTYGDFVWGKQFKGIMDFHENHGLGIAVDLSGNIYTSGSFGGTTGFNPGAGVDTLTPTAGTLSGSQDAFIAKLNADGNLIWADQIQGGGFSDDGIFIGDPGNIAVDNLGNVFTTGNFKGTTDFDPSGEVFNLTATGTEDFVNHKNMFVSKLDTYGTFVWAKQIGDAGIFIFPNDIAVDAAGSVYITGNYEGITDFNPGSGVHDMTPVGGDDVFICKLDSLGNFAWSKSIGGDGPDVGNGIVVDVTNNVYTIGSLSNTADFNPGSGEYNLSTTGQDVFVCKLDESGSFIGAGHMGGVSGDPDFPADKGNAITVDASSNIYLTGVLEGTIDLDPGAGISSVTSFGGSFNLDVFVEKLHDTLSTAAGIITHSPPGLNEFSIYPNPNTGNFYINADLETDSKLNIEVVDITG